MSVPINADAREIRSDIGTSRRYFYSRVEISSPVFSRKGPL